jgi:Spy/CpxP family protein refolding chaperone
MRTSAIIPRLLLLLLFVPLLISSGFGAPRSLRTETSHTLSDAQKQAIQHIRSESKKRAALPALHLARVVSKIYANMLADRPDENLRVRLSNEMKNVTWQLLAIKGQAIRETVNVLTPEQRQLIRVEMRKPGAPADLGELIAKTFGFPDN